MRGVAVLAIVGSLVVGVIGFVMSYTTLCRLAADRLHFSDGLAVWFPVGVDASIVSLLALDLYMVYVRTPWPLLRLAAHGMTAATIYFNAAAADRNEGDPVAAAGHGIMPVLFVVGVEAARRRLIAWAQLEDGTASEGVPLHRWLLEPWKAWPMYRRMRLHGIDSYEEAVAMEQERIGYRVMLDRKYPKGGWRKASSDERLPFTMAQYGYSVDDALALPARFEEAEQQRQENRRTAELEASARAEKARAEAEIARLRTAASVEAARHQVDAETGVAQAQASAALAQAQSAAEGERQAAQRQLEAAARAAEADGQAEESAAAAAARKRAAEDERRAAEADREAAEARERAAEAAERSAEVEWRAAENGRRAAAAEAGREEAARRAAEATKAAAEARKRAAEAEVRAVELEDHAKLSPKERSERRVARMILAAGGATEAVDLHTIAAAEGISQGTASERRTAAAALIANGYQPLSEEDAA
ncbi:DUF2637 domain-containing protein [Streptomyces chattanoogensis]|uniref:DUF2637 domain-containing protein n=1 Tax=Streptomyces chattanoogensis TaxID=66876 RepID=UPI00367E0D5C